MPLEVDLKKGLIRMGIQYQAYSSSQRVGTEWNSALLRNQGTSIVTIDDMIILQPGQSFAVEGNDGEVFRYSFNVIFSGAGQNSLVAVFKIFLT
jgi:hypothetical protein